MATLGKNHGHQWGDSMATSGEKPWPQLGRIRWPLTARSLDKAGLLADALGVVTGICLMAHEVQQAR
jgi:hypothetical protein